ncbi:Lrp/AsnC ligand binding domain-containing protein [Castellaniella sp.]|uniref:Lrp/AsnC ligand binding domain-containing protein n=1 Tax=Castellaniella sp. TaxID=1955812 RepID=UPI003A599684
MSVAMWPEIIQCCTISGDMDYLLRIQVSDLAAFFLCGLNQACLPHPGLRSWFSDPFAQLKKTVL